MAGGLKDTTLFYSNTFSVSSGILTFVVDTYTETFLQKIKKKYTEIDIEIGYSGTGVKNLILRDVALANPRVYIEGLPPAPLSSFYTKEEVDSLLSGKADKSQLLDYLPKNNPTGTGTLTIPSAAINGTLRNGNACDPKGDYSHAEGQLTNAVGQYSHAEGNMTRGNGFASHAEGRSSRAYSDYSHAEGDYSQTSGLASHAEGYNSRTNGSYSHAEGHSTFASGMASHAEGQLTNAIGQYSHAEGKDTSVYGYYSHVNGVSAVSYTAGSHVEGLGTKTHTAAATNYDDITKSYAFQHIEGKYNDTRSGKIKDMQCVVGGGSSDDDRKNIYLRDWNGNIWTSGVISGAHFYDTTTSSLIGTGGVTSTYVINTVSAATSGKADKSQLNNYLPKNNPTFTGTLKSSDDEFRVEDTAMLFGTNLEKSGYDDQKNLILGNYNDSSHDGIIVIGNGYYDQEQEEPQIRQNSLTIDINGNIQSEGNIYAKGYMNAYQMQANNFKCGNFYLQILNPYKTQYSIASVPLSFATRDTQYLIFSNNSHTDCSFTATGIRAYTIALVVYQNDVSARTLSFGGKVLCQGVGKWLIGLINLYGTVNLIGNPVELK